MAARFPILVFVVSFCVLWLSVRLGAIVRAQKGPLAKDERDDFNVIQGATLTLLGLLIGFSFSMALSRYDERKHYERVEANVIGTEYLRLDLLSDTAVVADLRELLKKFVDQRIRFYQTSDPRQIEDIDRDTAQLHNELWSLVSAEAAKQPTPITALVVEGMDDVLSVPGNTQASWWNRIPLGAWWMMGLIAAISGVMIGNGSHTKTIVRHPVFPLVVAIAFFFIADLDSPYGDSSASIRTIS